MAFPPGRPPVSPPEAVDAAPPVPPKPKKRTAIELAAFLKLARDRFTQAAQADEKQRLREREDLKFYAGDQWPDEIKKSRGGQPADGRIPPTPARPTFVINKVREPVHQVLNSERQADFNIELIPADDFGDLVPAADDTEVIVREGLVRRIQRASEAADARTWAFTRATIAGRGFYRVMTRYVPGKSWDQEVFVERLYNQASVSLDPAHEQPDGSDAKWAFDGGDLPWDEYEVTYPHLVDATGQTTKNPLVGSSSDEFRALGEDYPDWFSGEGATRSARVVNYWYTEWSSRTLAQLADGTASWEDEVPEGATVIDTRSVVEQQIKWAKIDATQILEETDWPGPDLPIVKILGEELQPYDKERRAEGMVRPARDANMGFNAMTSKWVEVVGYSPIPPPRVAEGQIEGYEGFYQAATTRMMAYLPYRTKALDGTPVGPPTRDWGEMPIAAIAGSIQMFDAAVKSTTGVPDPNLGHQTPNVKSGVMAQALIAQSQHGTSGYLDNYQRSMRYEAQIINNLLYPIYGRRPGRLARIVTSEGEPEMVRINALAGANAQSGASRPQGQPQTSQQQYRLTKGGNFHAVVKITRAFTSRREQEVSILGELLSANPMFMSWFGDLFFKNQDGPGHDQMAERAKLMLDPKIQALMDQQQQGQQIPSQVLAKMAALQKQVHDAEGVIQQAHQEIQGKQGEWDAKKELAQMELEGKKQLAQMELDSKAADRETKLAVAELGAKVERLQLFYEEQARIGVQQHEMALEAAKAHHEVKKLRITKTLNRAADGSILGATEDHQELPDDSPSVLDTGRVS